METKETTQLYLTMEDGESLVANDCGAVRITRESTVGIVKLYLRSDYAAAPDLLAACQCLESEMAWNHLSSSAKAVILAAIAHATKAD